MTKSEFAQGFDLLESAFGEQKAETRAFYFRQFEHTEASLFLRTARRIVETRDDGFGFPLVAEISRTFEEVLRDRPAADEEDLERRGYCQLCENVGFYKNDRGGASLCSCRAGRLKAARLRAGLGAKRKEVEEELKKLPPAEPPVRGLTEKNALGFWEDTLEEHERWMAAARTRLREIERRLPGRAERKSSVAGELQWEQFKDTLARLRLRRAPSAPAEREPGDDMEDEQDEDADKLPF